jgi:hypothetical protein
LHIYNNTLQKWILNFPRKATQNEEIKVCSKDLANLVEKNKVVKSGSLRFYLQFEALAANQSFKFPISKPKHYIYLSKSIKQVYLMTREPFKNCPSAPSCG